MQDRTLAIVRRICENNKITDDTDLFASGALDSLGTVNLLLAIEEEFGVYVPITEIDRDANVTPLYLAGIIKELANAAG